MKRVIINIGPGCSDQLITAAKFASKYETEFMDGRSSGGIHPVSFIDKLNSEYEFRAFHSGTTIYVDALLNKKAIKEETAHGSLIKWHFVN